MARKHKGYKKTQDFEHYYSQQFVFDEGFAMSPSKAESFLVILLVLNSCGLNYVKGQMNFSLEDVAGDMMLPLVAPLGAVARESGLIGGGWSADDDKHDDQDKPRRPPFPFFNLWKADWSVNSVLSRVEEELSLYAENLSPLAQTKEMIENNVVLENAEFRGLYEVKQVSAKS